VPGSDDEAVGSSSQHPLKGTAMIEKTASLHPEGPGKQGQEQIGNKTCARDHDPCRIAGRFADDRWEASPKEILVTLECGGT
jgi:hypothetical protein